MPGAALSTWWPGWRSLAGRHSLVAPTEPVRQRAGRGESDDVVTQAGDILLMTELWRGFVACREWSRAKKKSLGPLFPGHYLNFTFSACEGGVEAADG